MKAMHCMLLLFKVIFCGRLNQYVSDPIYLPHLVDEKSIMENQRS